MRNSSSPIYDIFVRRTIKYFIKNTENCPELYCVRPTVLKKDPISCPI